MTLGQLILGRPYSLQLLTGRGYLYPKSSETIYALEKGNDKAMPGLTITSCDIVKFGSFSPL